MLKSLISLVPMNALEMFEHYLMGDYKRTKHFLNTSDPDLLEKISEKKALAIFHKAVKNTPAYEKFLNKNRLKFPQINSIKTINDFNKLVPATEKDNYVKLYDFASRCKHGELPVRGNIDESSGTSGKATNWIHDIGEEDLLFKSVKFEYNYSFSNEKEDYLVISAWSSGPWATGVRFCELMEQVALVKNTDTNPDKIIETLETFGKNRRYLIGAYPPFIKSLLDNYKDRINWKDYKIDLVIGGEGVTLDWVYDVKNKLKKGAKIVSSYGSSDIDIGVGFETPLCFYIRELINKDLKLRKEIFGREDVPMIFQYNPTAHYIKNIIGEGDKSEFEVTLLDSNAALPKIKYNIHDEGKKFSFNNLFAIIEGRYPKFWDQFLRKSKTSEKDILNLPFLTIFGRSDGTLSFDGANVYPSQVENAILKSSNLDVMTNRFKIEKSFNENNNPVFNVHVELVEGKKPTASLRMEYSKSILQHLMAMNRDYCESYTQNNSLAPKIKLYKNDHSFFNVDNDKQKNIYIVK